MCSVDKIKDLLVKYTKKTLWFVFTFIIVGAIVLYLLNEYKISFSDHMTTIGIALVIVQIFIAEIYYIENNRRARKEKLHDVLSHWMENYVIYVQARGIVEVLNKDCLYHLEDREGKAIKVPISHKVDLLNVLEIDSSCISNEDDKSILLDGEYIIIKDGYNRKLRDQVIAYLNLLETIFIFWGNGSVEKEILKQQFEDYFRPKNNKYTLKEFRRVLDGEKTYPNIALFEEHILKNQYVN